MKGSTRNECRGTMRDRIVDPFLIVDRDSNVTYINRSCTDLIGYTKEEVMGTMSCRDIFQDEVCEAIDQCIETGEPVENRRVTVKDLRGQWIPLVTHAAPLKRCKDKIVVVFKKGVGVR